MLVMFEEQLDHTKSREGGKIVKQQIIHHLDSATSQNRIIFDFSGVSSISSSFADELFGKLISDMGFENFKAITTFQNLNPLVSSVIKNSIYHRNSQTIN